MIWHALCNVRGLQRRSTALFSINGIVRNKLIDCLLTTSPSHKSRPLPPNPTRQRAIPNSSLSRCANCCSLFSKTTDIDAYYKLTLISALEAPRALHHNTQCKQHHESNRDMWTYSNLVHPFSCHCHGCGIPPHHGFPHTGGFFPLNHVFREIISQSTRMILFFNSS